MMLFSKTFKGRVSRDFQLLVFFTNQFPQAPEYTLRVVSNFFENSRRYSQLKVCHRCQRHRWQIQKIFNHKSFNYLVWTPLRSIVNLCRWYQWQIDTGVVDTGGKFAASVVDTGGKFATCINNTSKTGRKICRRCRWCRGAPLLANISANFRKKYEMVLMGYSGAGGKLIHEKKTRSKKSRDTVHLKR